MELFPGLPMDLGRECLLRVCYKSHHNLPAVCRSWKAEVNGLQFYQDRKKLGTSQQCICLIELREYLGNITDNDLQFVVTVYDPLQGTWETLPRLPHFSGDHHGIPLFCECVSVNRKLVLIGGWNPSNPNLQEALQTVFIYDFSSAQWSRGADMPGVRISGAFCVSPEGLVYGAGGKDNDDNALRGAAVYNLEEDEWKLLPDMSKELGDCSCAFIDGKFFVIDESLQDRVERSAEVYDPERRSWTTLQNVFSVGDGEREGKGRPSFDTASDGRLCLFQKQQQGVMEYDSKENVWRVLMDSLPETLGRITSCVPWRDRIFVSGYAEGTYRDEVFYMSKPPPIQTSSGAQGETFGRWVAIERPEHSNLEYYRSVLSASTVEI